MDLFTRLNQIIHRIEELATCSEDPDRLTRTFGTDAFMQARNKIFTWMQEAGLSATIDNIGNVRGKWECSNPSAKTFVIGSHFDSVIDAGKYDGPLGVLMAIDLVQKLIIENEEFPFHIECVAFSDEEGVRFHTTYLGSKILAGTFEDQLLGKTDETGKRLQELIQDMGGNKDELANDAIPGNNWLGYFEIHIEQGPVLYQKNIPVAVVTGIAGQKRIELAFSGIAGHAGTVPMDMRNDALCAAAEYIIEVENYAKIHQDKFVATVGKLTIQNSASNVIAGNVKCSLDLRSIDENILSTNSVHLKELLKQICNKRNIDFKWNIIQESRPVFCNTKLNEVLKEAIIYNGIEVIELVSGAGHDAVTISEVAPVSMLFVRCFKGISHNPLENVEKKDIAAAINVADTFLSKLKNCTQ